MNLCSEFGMGLSDVPQEPQIRSRFVVATRTLIFIEVVCPVPENT
jgi:hypothetical protein